VLESRPADGGAAIRRRRECGACGGRFTTFERIGASELQVIKRNGRRQPFDPAKLRGALMRAAHKRDISVREVDELVAAIEAEARSTGGGIASEAIAELCLRRLQDLDHGAYLQFAGTLPSASADFAEFGGISGGSVPSGSSGSISTPRTPVPNER
jgi:transcriptional repressor NrdR